MCSPGSGLPPELDRLEEIPASRPLAGPRALPPPGSRLPPSPRLRRARGAAYLTREEAPDHLHPRPVPSLGARGRGLSLTSRPTSTGTVPTAPRAPTPASTTQATGTGASRLEPLDPAPADNPPVRGDPSRRLPARPLPQISTSSEYVRDVGRSALALDACDRAGNRDRSARLPGRFEALRHFSPEHSAGAPGRPFDLVQRSPVYGRIRLTPCLLFRAGKADPLRAGRRRRIMAGISENPPPGRPRYPHLAHRPPAGWRLGQTVRLPSTTLLQLWASTKAGAPLCLPGIAKLIVEALAELTRIAHQGCV